MNYDEDIMLMVLDLGRDLISTDGDAGQMLRMLAAEAIADGHGSEAHERLVTHVVEICHLKGWLSCV